MNPSAKTRKGFSHFPPVFLRLTPQKLLADWCVKKIMEIFVKIIPIFSRANREGNVPCNCIEIADAEGKKMYVLDPILLTGCYTQSSQTAFVQEDTTIQLQMESV